MCFLKANILQSPIFTDPDFATDKVIYEKPTLLKFTTAAAGVGVITFNSTNRGAPTTFTQGVDYCVGAGVCTDIDTTAIEFKNALNSQTAIEFDNLVAEYDSTKQTVSVFGLDNDEYFTVADNGTQSPELVNPGLNEVVFKQAIGAATLTINTLVIDAGDEICNVGCTDEITSAAALAEFINTATNTELQGISATHLTGTGRVILHGIEDGSYYITSLNSEKIGKISINQTIDKWVIPYIDGNNGNRVSIIRGDLKQQLAYSEPEIINLNTEVSDTVELDYDTDFFEMMVLAIQEVGDEVNIYEIDPFHNIKKQRLNLFTDEPVVDVRVALSKDPNDTEPSALVAARAVGALSAALIKSKNQEYDFLDANTDLDLGAGFSIIGNMTRFEMSAGVKENTFLLATNTQTTPGNFNTYILELAEQAATPNDLSINCSFDGADLVTEAKCMQIRPTTGISLNDFKPAIGPVLRNVTIGSSGATPNENIQSIIPLAITVDSGGTVPTLGLFNISPLKLTSDEGANTGTNAIIPFVPER